MQIMDEKWEKKEEEVRIFVSDIAKVYGMSKQNLHYYETRGVLKPCRDAANGYRYYSTSDLQKLGTIKKLRNAGFELAMGMDVQKGISSDRLMEAYAQRKQEVYEEIASSMRVLRQLDEDSAILMQYAQRGSEWVSEYCEERIRFEFYDEVSVMVDDILREKATPWFENIFFTAASHMVFTDAEGNFEGFSRGLLTTARIGQEVRLPMTENVCTIEAGNFATAIFHLEGSEEFASGKFLYTVYDALKKCCRFKVKGNLFTRVAHIYSNNEGKVEYYLKAYARIDE